MANGDNLLPQEYERWLEDNLDPIERRVERLSPTDEYLKLLIYTQLRTLAALEGAGEGVPTAAPSIMIPVTPENLNHFIMGMRRELMGIVGVHHYQYSILVSAGGTKTWVKTIPLGNVGVYTRGATINFTYHSEDILLDLMVGEERVSYDTPCIYDLHFPWGIYRPMGEGETITVYVRNNSATDTKMSPEMVALYMEKSYFEDVYRPMLSKAYAGLEDWLYFQQQTLEYARAKR